MSWSKYDWVNGSAPAIDATFLNALDDEIIRLDNAKINKTGNVTVDGIKTFTLSPIVPTPTTDFQTATKKYVDDEIGGIEGVTTASVLSAIAGSTEGETGTLVWGKYTGIASFGANISGSSIQPVGIRIDQNNVPFFISETSFLDGTWKCLGRGGVSVSQQVATLFLKIA